MTALLCFYREYHSGVVTAKREKQSQLKIEDYVSRTGTNQELSTTDDLAGFQTEHSAKATGASGKGIMIVLPITSFSAFSLHVGTLHLFVYVGKKKRAQTKDEEHYLHYTPSDLHSEQG